MAQLYQPGRNYRKMKPGTAIISFSFSTKTCFFEEITKMLGLSPSETLILKTGGFYWNYEIKLENVYYTTTLIKKLMKVLKRKTDIIRQIALTYDAKVNIEFVLYHPRDTIGIIFPHNFIMFVDKCGASISIDQYMWED